MSDCCGCGGLCSYILSRVVGCIGTAIATLFQRPVLAGNDRLERDQSIEAVVVENTSGEQQLEPVAMDDTGTRDEQDVLVAMPVAVSITTTGEPEMEEGNIARATDGSLDETSSSSSASSPYLLHMIQEGLPCCSVLSGVGTRSCRDIVECIVNRPELTSYTCPTTGRRPIHEAAWQCCCSHVMDALIQQNGALIQQNDSDTDIDNDSGSGDVRTLVDDICQDTPLHLLFRGVARRNVNVNDFVRVVTLLLERPLPLSDIASVTTASAATMSNQNGDTALHLACRVVPESLVPSRAMDLLLQQDDDDDHSAAAAASATLHRNHAGQTPLHLHCQRRGASLHLAQQLIEAATVATAAAATLAHNLAHGIVPPGPLLPLWPLPQPAARHPLPPPPLPFRCSLDNTEHGQSELHHAAHAMNYDLIQLLVSTDAHSASNRTRTDDRSALHILCLQYHAHGNTENAGLVPAVQCLLAAAPTMASRRDCGPHSSTPLHLLLSNIRDNRASSSSSRRRRHSCNVNDDGSSSTICLAIVQAIVQGGGPDCLGIADGDGFLPLHYAVRNGVDTSIVEFLLRVHPATATALTRKNDTALSLACSCIGTTTAATNVKESIHLLLQANVSATDVANDYGFLPLHCACRTASATATHNSQQLLLAIVQMLVDANPSSVRRSTNAGELPVHLAHGASRAVLALLTAGVDNEDMNGNSAMTNKVGNTPLHYACASRDASMDSIEALAESNPSWIVATNHAGLTPLHILCKNARLNAPIVATFARLGGSHRVFSTVDAMGNTPLHSAMRQETDIDALRALMRAYPQALQVQTQYNDTPLTLACLRNVHHSVVCEVAQETWLRSSEYGPTTRHCGSPLLKSNRAGQTPLGIVMEEFQRASADFSTTCRVTSTREIVPAEVPSFVLLSAFVKLLHNGPEAQTTDNDQSLLAACLSLHRLYSVRLNPNFIRWALIANPREAMVAIVDQNGHGNGNYPLHIEAGIPVEKMTLLNASTTPCRACGSANCGYQRMDVLHTLTELYPDAAKVCNDHGDFPLNLMIRSGRVWDTTFALVVRSHPEALHDASSSISNRTVLPHVLAKVEHCCGLDTLYSLVRSRPELLAES